ncbi:histidine phosphatase family protein [Streptomyces bambusae]|uniref:histidine phosphatase family protein n=1 Tax=Streptomyces bambusae TaxID=1550616 RepID=UPI0027E04AA0|nr:histidine phosphatase family protein [Streptomyces bambusae]
MSSASVRVRLCTRDLVPGFRFGACEAPPGAPQLRGPDAGEWHGRSLDEVAAADPEAVRRWLTDPAYAPPGGESVETLVARVGTWLDGLAPGTAEVVVEQAVVRAAVVHALGLPAAVFWRLDARPGTVTELSGRAGRWNLRLGAPAER